MRHIILIFLVIFTFTGFAQQEGLLRIDTLDLKQNLTFLAADELQGRCLGTEVDGLGIAADFLAKKAEEIGLKPGAGDYFQPVPIVGSTNDDGKFIEVNTSKGKSVYNSSLLVKLDRNPLVLELENEPVVFIGFAENIENLDLEGKVVAVALGDAESYKKESIGWSNQLEQKKIRAVSKKEPKAILVIASPNDEENKTFSKVNGWFNRPGYTLKKQGTVQKVPVLLSVPEVGDALLGKKRSFTKYLNELVEGKKNVEHISKNNLKLKINMAPVEFPGKNVIGVVEGSDPKLKDEYIVFVAHYDHLGVDKNGEVYNGADDNGSGTVAILEVAEAFAGMEKKPKRSIVFLWVTSEEVGHLGSSYYADHPIFPLEKTVAAINLDMVGRVYEGPRDDVWKDSPKKVKEFDGLYTLSNDVWPELAEMNAEKCAELGLIPDTSLPKKRFLRASDHYHFHKKGVPILNYATGYHADYHKIGDEVDKINFEKIKRVADLCYLLGLEIANCNDIKFKLPY